MRNKIVIILAVIILALSGMVYYQFNAILVLNDEKDQLIDVVNDSARVATTYRNKYKELVSFNEVLLLTDRNARDLAKTKELDWIRKFDGLNNKTKRLEEAVRLQTKVNVDLRLSLNESATFDPSFDWDITAPPQDLGAMHFKGDSSKVRKTAEYNDQWNRLRFTILDDSVLVKANIEVPIDGVVYWRRKKFLLLRIGKKEHFSEFKSDNNWVEIKNSEVIKVVKRNHR